MFRGSGVRGERDGNQIVIDVPEDQIGQTNAPINRYALMNLLEEEKWTQMCETKLVDVTEDEVIVERKGEKLSLQADTVILAMGGKPNTELLSGFQNKRVEVGRKVVICGGLSGTECALDLAYEGKDVTVVDMLPAAAFAKDAAPLALHHAPRAAQAEQSINPRSA